MPRKVLIELRRDTAANWTSVNPVLAAGEPGWESDTNQLKFGDGSTRWNSLPYFSGAPDADPSFSLLTNPAVPDLIFTSDGDVIVTSG